MVQGGLDVIEVFNNAGSKVSLSDGSMMGSSEFCRLSSSCCW
jgi:hypothetical protein